MVAPVTVREKDLRTLLGIVGEDRAGPAAAGGLPLSLLADLMGQIRCDQVTFGRPRFQRADGSCSRRDPRPGRWRGQDDGPGVLGATTGTAITAPTS